MTQQRRPKNQELVSNNESLYMSVTDAIYQPAHHAPSGPVPFYREDRVKASITVSNLSLSLQGKTLLDAVSFTLHPCEHLAITGISGAGKTLLAKAIAGKLFHKGTVAFTKENCSLHFVEQHYHFKTLSNTSDFYYQQRYNSFDNEDAPTVEKELNAICNNTEKVQQLLETLHLSHKAASPLLHLSSGEHKRFQLIKAFLAPSNVLLLDEPFTGLDSSSRKELNNILHGLAAQGTQVICITTADEIPSCITHVALLEKGKLVSFSSKVIFQHSCVYTTNLLRGNFSNFPSSNTVKTNFEKAVRMEDVTVKYGDKTILHHINWEVNRGERWLLKGHNGTGKSTLLSLIYGDNPQTYANKIWLFDRRRGSGESIWDIKNNIGYISPELHWYFDRNTTCYDVIGSGFFDTIGLFRKLSIQQQQITEQWLDLFRLNISHVQKQPLSAISTGEQRLTLLIRALVKDPPLLLLDEPCQGLDALQTKRFVELVDDLCTQLDKTLIYISHYDHEIPQCINKVIELKEGKQNIYSLNNAAAVAV